jgi:hypothetical protein
MRIVKRIGMTIVSFVLLVLVFGSVLDACAELQGVQPLQIQAQALIHDYCSKPALARQFFRDQVNARIAPNQIRIACVEAGDRPIP